MFNRTRIDMKYVTERLNVFRKMIQEVQSVCVCNPFLMFFKRGDHKFVEWHIQLFYTIETAQAFARNRAHRGDDNEQFRVESVNDFLFVWSMTTNAKICHCSHEWAIPVSRNVVFSLKHLTNTVVSEQTIPIWGCFFLLKLHIFSG